MIIRKYAGFRVNGKRWIEVALDFVSRQALNRSADKCKNDRSAAKL